MVKIEHATIVYSINLTNVEVPDGSKIDERQEILVREAEKHFPHGLNKPIIHDCSDPDLIE